MKKIILLCSALLLSLASLCAAPVSPAKAAQKAKNLMDRLAPTLRADLNLKLDYTYSPALAAQYGIASTSKALQDTPFFYVFNRGNAEGYILIAADDRLPESIAYSASGSFDMTKLPENLRAWLSHYDAEIASVLKSQSENSEPYTYNHRTEGVPAAVPAIFDSGTHEADPIRWDQGHPFNSKEPVLSNGKKAYTGCVATAMAMIMKHFEWPNKAEGSYNYTDYMYGNNTNYNGYFGYEYDWANMPGTSSNPALPIHAQAYGTFMLDCSMSVEMQFSFNGSGTYSQYVVRALRDNFKYKKSLSMKNRWMHSAIEWEDMIRRELAANRPVYYSGDDESAGHAFVCDGYDAAGSFHFNWGWSGSGNGYYRLTLLSPDNLGIGAGGGAFTTNQSIIIGIEPAKNPDEANEIAAPEIGIFAMNSIKRVDDQVKVKAKIINYGEITSSIEVAYRLKKADGNETIKEIVQHEFIWGTPQNQKNIEFDIPVSELVAGRNEVTLLFRRNGAGDNSWAAIKAHINNARNPFYITLKEDGNTSFEYGAYSFNLTVPEDGIVGVFKHKKKCDIEITFLNDMPNEMRSRTDFALQGEDGKRHELTESWIMCEYAANNAPTTIKFTTIRLNMPMGTYKLQYRVRDLSAQWKTIRNVEVVSPTSINDALNSDATFVVYPTLSDGYVTAQMPMGAESLRIFDSNGRLQVSHNVSGQSQVQIDMSRWNSGMYLFLLDGATLNEAAKTAVKVIRK